MTESQPGTLWLPRRNTTKHRQIRLFCFPFAGGGTAQYHRWSRELPDDVEVLPVKLPGREERIGEEPFESITLLLDALIQEIRGLLDLPVVLFGQSMGALIAFEVARQLRRRLDVTPLSLIVAASRAPQLPADTPLIHQLADDQLIGELQHRFGGFAPRIAENEEMIRQVLPTLRADMTLIENYEYRTDAPLDCPILALGGSQDKCVSAADLMAWRHQTTRDFSHRMVVGDHFFVETSRKTVLSIIHRRLETFFKS